MENIKQALNISLMGMLGIFFVLGLIYLLILFLLWAFPEKKRVKRTILRSTGEVIEEHEMKPGEE